MRLLRRFLGECKLLGGQCDAGDLAAIFTRREHREAAPAAADLQDVHPFAQVQHVRQLAPFVALRVFQLLPRVVEHRRGIGHRRIEPLRIERVAQIVMRRDVLACAAPGVGAQLVRHQAGPFQRCDAGQRVGQSVHVAGPEFEHRRQIRARPVAVHVGFRQPDFAAQKQAPEAAGAGDFQNRFGAMLRGLDRALSAVGEAKDHFAFRDIAHRAGHHVAPERRANVIQLRRQVPLRFVRHVALHMSARLQRRQQNMAVRAHQPSIATVKWRGAM